MITELGSAIRAARLERGLRQRQLAEAMNVTRAAVGQWEAGTNVPSSSNLLRLARMLDLNLKVSENHADLIYTVLSIKDEILAVEQTLKNSGIPVTHIVGGDKGVVYALGEGKMRLRYLDIFDGKSDIYAMLFTTNNLEPRYEKGDCVYVDPHALPARGEYGVFEIDLKKEGGKKYQIVRRLIHRDAKRVVLAQFRPEVSDEFAREQVTWMRRVIPELDLVELRGK